MGENNIRLQDVKVQGTASVRWPEGHPTPEDLEKARRWAEEHPDEAGPTPPAPVAPETHP